MRPSSPSSPSSDSSGSSDGAAAELSERLLAFLKAPGYSPQDASGLARGLGLDARERPALRELLRRWTDEGRLMKLRQARYALRGVADGALTGRVTQLPSGKLLFVADAAGQERLRERTGAAGLVELPVKPFRSLGAMDGDRVRATVRLSPAAGYRRRGKGKRPTEADLRPEVRVEEILERRRGAWVGIYQAEGRYGVALGDGVSSPKRVTLTEPPPPGLLAGMRVCVEARSYPRGRMEATGRVTEVLGWPEDEGVEVTTLIRKYGLRDAFPEEALAEAQALPEAPTEEDVARREDWRARCVVTIDPATARDFDDAFAVSALPGGGWELAVHIADVSHYVRPGGALDREAELRGNSTYLPDRVLPMLPPRLCDGLCSLREGEDRLTCLCAMRFDEKGAAKGARFARAVIRSRRRLDYAAALAVLEGRGSSGSEEVDAMLRTGNALAATLRRRRFAAGALDLEMPELRVLVDAHGRPTGVELERGDVSHWMIEEFMLAANEAVARALREALLPAVYRVHEEPDPAKLHEFSLQARSCGIPCGSLQSREELREVMEAMKGNAEEPRLKVALLRAMMRARYDTRPLGHYGLAKGDYCHFTSPIRRYADLVAHRAFARLCGEHGGLASAARLASVAEHISETERNSAAAEHEARQLMLLEFMQLQCEAERPLAWEAVVTASWPQGLAVELPELQLKGFVSGERLRALASGRWFHEAHACRWTSSSGERLHPGSRLRVAPLRVDRASGFLDFTPVAED